VAGVCGGLGAAGGAGDGASLATISLFAVLIETEAHCEVEHLRNSREARHGQFVQAWEFLLARIGAGFKPRDAKARLEWWSNGNEEIVVGSDIFIKKAVSEKWGQKDESPPLRSKRGAGGTMFLPRIFLTFSATGGLGQKWRAHEQRAAATKAKMADGKGRGDVKAMIVRGIILKTLYSILLTYIPLTLVNSRKITGRRSRAKTTQAPILVFFAFVCGKNLVGIA
jgi:hypothetical protein